MNKIENVLFYGVEDKIQKMNSLTKIEYIDDIAPNKIYYVIENWDNHNCKIKRPFSFTATFVKKFHTYHATILIFNENNSNRYVCGMNKFYLCTNLALPEIQNYIAKIPSLQTLAKRQLTTSEAVYVQQLPGIYN